MSNVTHFKDSGRIDEECIFRGAHRKVCAICGFNNGEHYFVSDVCPIDIPSHRTVSIAFIGYAYFKYYHNISNNKRI